MSEGSLRWRSFAPWLKSSRRGLVWASVAVSFDAALTLCRPWPLKVVIDRILLHSARATRVPLLGPFIDRAHVSPRALLFACCATSIVIAVGTGFFTYQFTRTMGDVGRHFAFELRRDLFAHLQRLSLRFHDGQRTGDLTTRLTADVASMQEAVASAGVVFLSNALLLLGMVLTMLWLNWKFALVALSLAPFLFFTVFRYTKRIKAAARMARRSDGLLASVANETFSAIRVVQGLAREDLQSDRFQTQNQNSLEAYLEGVRYQARIAPLVDVLAGGGAALVMLYGAFGVVNGTLTTGDVVVFFAYVTNLYSPMRAIARLSFALTKASVGAERISAALAVQREVQDRENARAAPVLRGELTLRDVSFEYAPGRPVLESLTLHVKAGEKLAIVGSTGAGKSTLVSLIPRLYDPGAGVVAIDGVDVRDFELRSLREQIALVLQDSLLFSGSIRANIAFGRAQATEQEIVAAARVAGADDFIRALPDGYDTLVGERGATLSGGQRQRIAIARAIVRQAPILILDEPTSGLDVATERRLIETLEKVAEGRTTLIIAHRLSTVRMADRIVVLENGKIVEQGSHDYLLCLGGRYAELYLGGRPNLEVVAS